MLSAFLCSTGSRVRCKGVGVISERWFDGIWLGVQFTSGEHLVATSDGRVIRARAVHPRPETVKVTRGASPQ